MVTVADLRAGNYRVRVNGRPAKVVDYWDTVGSGMAQGSDLPTTLRVIYDDDSAGSSEPGAGARVNVPNDTAITLDPLNA